MIYNNHKLVKIKRNDVFISSREKSPGHKNVEDDKNEKY